MWKNNIKLKVEKCEFFVDKYVCMGFLLDCNGVYLIEEKVKVINNVFRFIGVKELKVFFGVLNFYGDFLLNLSIEL